MVNRLADTSHLELYLLSPALEGNYDILKIEILFFNKIVIWTHVEH